MGKYTDLITASNCSLCIFCSLQTAAPAGKENAPVSTNLKQAAAAPAQQAVTLEEVRKNLTCGICSSLLASSLVLSCGHIFCGQCLFDYLNTKPSCPTCQVRQRHRVLQLSIAVARSTRTRIANSDCHKYSLCTAVVSTGQP